MRENQTMLSLCNQKMLTSFDELACYSVTFTDIDSPSKNQDAVCYDYDGQTAFVSERFVPPTVAGAQIVVDGLSPGYKRLRLIGQSAMSSRPTAQKIRSELFRSFRLQINLIVTKQ